jgi:predicted PurR-regulated permease PerM
MAIASKARRGDRRDEPRRFAGLRPLPRLALEFILLVAAATLVVYALLRVEIVVLPVFFALLLSAVLRPPHRLLTRVGVPSALAALLVTVGFVALVVGALVLVIPQFASQVDDLVTSVTQGLDRVTNFVTDLPFGITEQDVNGALGRLEDRLRANLGAISQQVVQGLLLVGTLLAEALLTLVVTFFFVHDGDRIWRWVVSLMPRRRRAQIREVGDRAWSTLGGYLRGVLFVAVVDSVFIGLGAWIIGVPLVLPIMVLTFIGAFVPIVGATVAGGIAVLVALVSEGPIDALLVLGVVLLVQQVEGNVLYPFIVGRSLELHPVATLLAVTAGGTLAGIIGALLAVPVLAVGWQVIQYLRERTGEDDEDVVPGAP